MTTEDRRLTPDELTREITHRMNERLAISGWTNRNNTHPAAVEFAWGDASEWARANYPETCKRLGVGILKP